MLPGDVLGRRLPEGTDANELLPGDYCRWKGRDDRWLICLPTGQYGTLFTGPGGHTVTEHDDGTITVEPSILFHPRSDGTMGWHGYLKAGVWRTA